MRLALTADWLPVFAGAEHVIAEFHTLWPSAPIFTTVAARRGLGPLQDADIRVSRLQPWFQFLQDHRLLLPWMPAAMEAMDLRGYDIILSSSHAVGKGIVPPSSATHICYCHTPMRYAWEMEEKYLHDFRIPKLARKTVKRLLTKLRRWDLTTAKRVDVFIANSTETQSRIRSVYRRESTVVPPPIHERFFAYPLSREQMERRHAYLAIGRMVPYKRFDLVIAFANAHRLPLVIAGTGPDEKRLRRLAGPTVTFLGFVADEDLPRIYANARALLFPPHEDAGIVPLEAQACGTPVIAFRRGGAADSVKEGVSGLFFSDQSTDAIAEALARFEDMTLDPMAIRAHAKQYSAERFREKIRTIVNDTTQDISLKLTD